MRIEIYLLDIYYNSMIYFDEYCKKKLKPHYVTDISWFNFIIYLNV